MNIWLKIGIEIVLALLVLWVSRFYWLLWRQSYYFKDALRQEKWIELALEWIDTPAGAMSLESKTLDALDSGYGAADTSKYPIVLVSYLSAAFKTWRVTKLWHLVGFLILLIGSFFLSWIFALINLLLFSLLRFKKISPDLANAIDNVSRTVAVIVKIVQRWWRADPIKCRRWCTELSPQFTTVFEVVSRTDMTPAGSDEGIEA